MAAKSAHAPSALPPQVAEHAEVGGHHEPAQGHERRDADHEEAGLLAEALAKQLKEIEADKVSSPIITSLAASLTVDWMERRSAPAVRGATITARPASLSTSSCSPARSAPPTP